jgi:hypothetical protein
MVKLMMGRLIMVPHRGVPVVAVRVSERHRRGSERGYDEDSKSLLENVFHGNPGGSMGVSDEKRDAMPQTTAMRRHFNVVTDFESGAQPTCLAPARMHVPTGQCGNAKAKCDISLLKSLSIRAFSRTVAEFQPAYPVSKGPMM